jgi:hypothetical protein
MTRKRLLMVGFPLFVGLSILLVFSSPVFSLADNSATPTPSALTASQPTTQQYGSTKLLEIHKPMIPPAWGRVIQFKKDINFVLVGHDQETLYEFVLETSDGIIRTATYHETSDGDGYWEVYVWDQP